MITVIGIGHFGLVILQNLGQVIVCILIGGSLGLQVLHRNNIAVFIVGVTVAEFFLIQLNTVKVSSIAIVIVLNIHIDRRIILLRNCYTCSILPAVQTVRIRVKGNKLLGSRTVCVLEI